MQSCARLRWSKPPWQPGVNFRLRDSDGVTVLFSADRYKADGFALRARHLARFGAIDLTEYERLTALPVPIKCGVVGTVRTLLERGQPEHPWRDRMLCRIAPFGGDPGNQCAGRQGRSARCPNHRPSVTADTIWAQTIGNREVRCTDEDCRQPPPTAGSRTVCNLISNAQRLARFTPRSQPRDIFAGRVDLCRTHFRTGHPRSGQAFSVKNDAPHVHGKRTGASAARKIPRVPVHDQGRRMPICRSAAAKGRPWYQGQVRRPAMQCNDDPVFRIAPFKDDFRTLEVDGRPAFRFTPLCETGIRLNMAICDEFSLCSNRSCAVTGRM